MQALYGLQVDVEGLSKGSRRRGLEGLSMAYLKALERDFWMTGLMGSLRIAPPAPSEAALRASPASCMGMSPWPSAADGTSIV